MQGTPLFHRCILYVVCAIPLVALVVFVLNDMVYGFDGWFMVNAVWNRTLIANMAMVAVFAAVLFSFNLVKNNDTKQTAMFKGAFFLTNLFCARLLMPDIDYYLFVLISIIFIILAYNGDDKPKKDKTHLLAAAAFCGLYAAFRGFEFIGGSESYSDMQPNPIVFLMPLPLLLLLHHNKKFRWIPILLIGILLNPTGKFVTIALFPVFYALMIDLKLPKKPSVFLMLVMVISIGVYIGSIFYAVESAKVVLNDCCTEDTCHLTSTECKNWKQFFIYREKMLIESEGLGEGLSRVSPSWVNE